MASFKTAAKATGAASAVAGFILLCMSYIGPHEGTRYVAYWDGSAWTIGKGHTEGVHEGMVADQAQVNAWFLEDTTKAVAGVDRLTGGKPLPDGFKKVLVDQAFNSGTASLEGTTLMAKTNAGDLVGACQEFPKWNKAKVPKGSPADMRDGKRDGHALCTIRANQCFGIITRRAQQMADCLKGLQ